VIILLINQRNTYNVRVSLATVIKLLKVGCFTFALLLCAANVWSSISLNNWSAAVAWLVSLSCVTVVMLLGIKKNH
jgi:hypothetical protein